MSLSSFYKWKKHIVSLLLVFIKPQETLLHRDAIPKINVMKKLKKCCLLSNMKPLGEIVFIKSFLRCCFQTRNDIMVNFTDVVKKLRNFVGHPKETLLCAKKSNNFSFLEEDFCKRNHCVRFACLTVYLSPPTPNLHGTTWS